MSIIERNILFTNDKSDDCEIMEQRHQLTSGKELLIKTQMIWRNAYYEGDPSYIFRFGTRTKVEMKLYDAKGNLIMEE